MQTHEIKSKFDQTSILCDYWPSHLFHSVEEQDQCRQLFAHERCVDFVFRCKFRTLRDVDFAESQVFQRISESEKTRSETEECMQRSGTYFAESSENTDANSTEVGFHAAYNSISQYVSFLLLMSCSMSSGRK